MPAGSVRPPTEAGQPFVIEDSAGNVDARDRGVLRYTVLFDTLGDGMPGGGAPGRDH